MAGRITTQHIIRQIHRISSMVIFLYLLMWVFSGVILINRDAFNIPERKESSTTIPVEQKLEGDPLEYAEMLAGELNIKGRIEHRQDWKKSWIFNYNFPGKWVTITLSPEQDSLHIKTATQERTFFTTVQQMHVLRGFKGGWPYTLWAVFYDTACFALLVFVITGIILWLRSRKAYPYGWIFLLAGLILPLLFGFLFLLSR